MGALSGKVLLVKPDYRHFPIGMAYVVAALVKNGIDYDFVDTCLEPNADIAGKLRTGNYVAVATGGLLGNFSFYRRLFARVKEAAPHMPCVLGGQVTSDVDPALLFTTRADYLVVGEGEITFPELLKAIDAKADVSTIAGVVYRDPDAPGGFVRNARRHRIDLLAENSFPNWDFFDIRAYGFDWMPVLTGRGCTGHCSFCSPTNGRFRPRNVEQTIEEIEWLNSRYNPPNFWFLNEILFPTDQEVVEFCQRYKEIKPFKNWICLMRMDVRPDALPIMKEAGCVMMNVGVESGSDRVLREILKDIDVEQVRGFATKAREVGIRLDASFMMGNLNEDEEDIVQTIDLLLEQRMWGPMALTINYPGTRNYRHALKKGLIPDELAYLESLELLFGHNPQEVVENHLAGRARYLNLSAMPDERLFQTYEREMRRYFTNILVVPDAAVETTTRPDGPPQARLTGACPICREGAVTQDVRTDVGILTQLRARCDRCGNNQLYFPLGTVPAQRDHVAAIAPVLDEADRIAVIGYPAEVRFFFSYDVVGLDYAKVIGVAAVDALRPGEFVICNKIYPLAELLAMQPDVVLVLGSLPPRLAKALATATAFKGRYVNLMAGWTDVADADHGFSQGPVPSIAAPEIARRLLNRLASSARRLFQ